MKNARFPQQHRVSTVCWVRVPPQRSRKVLYKVPPKSPHAVGDILCFFDKWKGQLITELPSRIQLFRGQRSSLLLFFFSLDFCVFSMTVAIGSHPSCLGEKIHVEDLAEPVKFVLEVDAWVSNCLRQLQR